jgi:hypothetical protein
MASPVRARLISGISRMHDDACRREFLLETGAVLDGISNWIRENGLGEQVSAAHSPTFLHGGTSEGRWIVLGINPGADDQSLGAEEEFKRASPRQYLAFHERFFFEFPRLRRNSKQSWWSKLYRITRLLNGVVAESSAVSWTELQASSPFVVQDLLPFHGHSSRTLGSMTGGVLREIADATIGGIASSVARGAFVFSRNGYDLFQGHDRVLVTRRFVLQGRTEKGGLREVGGYFARIGKIPVVALDNEYVAQPTIPYAQSLPQLLAELQREGLV